MSFQSSERTQLINNDGLSRSTTIASFLRGCWAKTDESTTNLKIRPIQTVAGAIILVSLMIGSFYAGHVQHRCKLKFSPTTPENVVSRSSARKGSATNSKYHHVQGIGFQIYTGGAPAQIKNSSGTTIRNPECNAAIGQVVTDTEPELQCYLGVKGNAMEDARRRLEVMKQTVWQAHDMACKDADVLKVFVAPEFFWRGAEGAYIFAEEKPDDDETCGPICYILEELERFVSDKSFEDWVFLFGTIIASEVLPKVDAFDFLFYNFAPVYKGFDPRGNSANGKRFLLPKRFVSSSDFLTPQRHLNLTDVVEILGRDAMNQLLKQDTTVENPFDAKQKRYDDHIWKKYKSDQSLKGYAMIEYDWLMIDGLAFSMEICFDHQMHTAQNTYLGDLVTGRKTLIPSSSDKGLTYVPMPPYQAQISVVSSAGMTIVPESMALADNGVVFLQDGLSNKTNRKFWSNQGLEFDGGTEAVQRRALLTNTDVSFHYNTLQPPIKKSLEGWEGLIEGIFSTKMYQPEVVLFDPIPIAETFDD